MTVAMYLSIWYDSPSSKMEPTYWQLFRSLQYVRVGVSEKARIPQSCHVAAKVPIHRDLQHRTPDL